jgi:signal transduction histidine kinase
MTTLASFIEEDDAESLGAESLEHLRLLRERGQMALRMVDGLLQLARQGANEQVEEVELGPLAQEAFELVGATGAFSLHLDAEVPAFRTSRAALLQVIFNLLANAVRHHDKEKGELSVEARLMGDEVEVRVSDDGPGIPDKFKSDVFAVFRKLKKNDDGVGLGLSLVKKRVESAGGVIRLEDAVPRGLVAIFTWSLLAKSRDNSGGID